MFSEAVSRVAAFSDDGVLAELRSIEADQRALDARRAVALAAAERRNLHRRDSHASMYGLLRAKLGWSEAECRTRMQMARLVDRFPDVGEALDDTRVPVASVAVMARTFANPRIGEQIESEIGVFINAAARKEHDDFRRDVERYEQITDSVGANQARERSHENRTAHFGVFRGKGELAAQWGEVDSLANREIFDRFLEVEFLDDWEAAKQIYGDDTTRMVLRRTDAQRRADALSRIFQRAASSPPGSKPPKSVVNWFVDHRTMSDEMALAGLFPERARNPFEEGDPLITRRRCETSDGDIVDPRTILQQALEGYVRFVILNDEGIPIRWGRERRLFEGAARDAVMSLSPRCTHPGCRVRARRGEADHSKRYADGGCTDPDNGNPRCKRQNLDKERKGYSTYRDSEGVWHTFHPDGTEIG